MKYGLAAAGIAALNSVTDRSTGHKPKVTAAKAGHSRRTSQKKRRLLRRRVS